MLTIELMANIAISPQDGQQDGKDQTLMRKPSCLTQLSP